MPFSRHHLWGNLIKAYRPMNVIIHPLTFEGEIPVDYTEKWVEPFISGKAAGFNQSVLLNDFIQNAPIVDDDYYVTVSDDDMYEAGVFDAIQKMDDPVVVIGMKTGHRIPEGTPPLKSYMPTILDAMSENVKVGLIGGEQIFMKGSVLKVIRFDESNPQTADGKLAEYLKTVYPIRYEPDLFALFNYFEPGRWKKGSNMKISNFNLCIGIPLTFPMVPSGFFYSFAHMEKPKEYTLIHADNGSGAVDALRNDLVDMALQIGASHLIMMDTDQIYPVETIPRLLSHKLPIVGCVVHRRYPPFDPILLRGKLGDYESIDEWKDGELVEVDATGAGCLMFNMEVFRKMPRPWFKWRKIETGEGVGEDIGFCSDLKAAGYHIFVDTSIQCGHLTTLCVDKNTYALYKSVKIKQHKEALQRALSNGESK